MNHDWHDLIQRYIAGTLPDDEALALQNALKSDKELVALKNLLYSCTRAV